MTKVYWCTDKHDCEESTVIVNGNGCAWVSGHDSDFDVMKTQENNLIYNSSSSFEERAINPVLMAEW